MVRGSTKLLILGGTLCFAHAASAERPRLVDLARTIPSMHIDLRYASENNVFARRLYPRNAKAFLLAPVARRLAKVQRRLMRRGLSLLVWDAYRPSAVQWAMWKHKKDRRYVADPRRGSDHSRGAAVDVTLVQSQGGAPLPMPTAFDDFTPKARGRRCPRAEARRCVNAALLRREMRRAGFIPLASEWWHFRAPEARRYPLLNRPLRP